MSQSGISFRKIEITDAGTIAGWYNDKDNIKYMSTVVRCKNHTQALVEEEIKRMDDDYERLFMVVAEKDGHPIGQAGIDDIDFDDKRGEIFFLIGEKEEKGKGHGKRIVAWLLAHAFDELHLNSLFATVAVENKPSMAILEKAGFKRIGLRRDYNFINGAFMDEVFFDMTLKDYRQIHGSGE